VQQWVFSNYNLEADILFNKEEYVHRTNERVTASSPYIHTFLSQLLEYELDNGDVADLVLQDTPYDKKEESCNH